MFYLWSLKSKLIMGGIFGLGFFILIKPGFELSDILEKLLVSSFIFLLVLAVLTIKDWERNYLWTMVIKRVLRDKARAGKKDDKAK